MSKAVIFDSAGTLLHTYRVAKDIMNNNICENIETTTLTCSSDERALILLYAHSLDIINAHPDTPLSSFLVVKQIQFGVACARKVISSEIVGDLLYNDTYAHVGDLQECIRRVWDICKKNKIVAMNSGVLLNRELGGIEYVITSGGCPFPNAKSTITKLHQMGIATYIASGDRPDKLVRMADYLGIPHDNVHGVATPTIKAQIVEDLKKQYDTVVMVGDGINDLNAMNKADLAILTEQQSEKKSELLLNAADHIIKKVSEVPNIIQKMDYTRSG